MLNKIHFPKPQEGKSSQLRPYVIAYARPLNNLEKKKKKK
jgi:hypothetical protein